MKIIYNKWANRIENKNLSETERLKWCGDNKERERGREREDGGERLRVVKL